MIFSRCTIYLLQYHVLISREIQGLCEILKFASESEDAESKSSPMQLPYGQKAPEKLWREAKPGLSLSPLGVNAQEKCPCGQWVTVGYSASCWNESI